MCSDCSARSRCGGLSGHDGWNAQPHGSATIPDDFSTSTCTRCHAAQVDATTQVLAQRRSEEYRSALRRRARIIGVLPQHITQRQLERFLCLSQGCLSRLRFGAGTPSPELVSLLALLARDADMRLQELERYWNGADDQG